MIKKWIGCIGEYRRDMILAPFFVALEVVMDIAIPLLMAAMIDKGISAGDMNAVWQTGIRLVLMCMLALLFGILAGRFSARVSSGFAKNLRKSMFRKVQEFSFSNIDRFSPSSLVTRLTTDITNIQNAFQMMMRISSRAPLMMIFATFMAFRISPPLAWVFMAVIPVLSLGLLTIILKANPLFVRVFRLYDRLNMLVQENLRGIRVVKSYVREDHETEKFQAGSKEIHDTFVTAEKILAFNSPLMQFCMYTCTLFVCWLGARMIVSGSLSTGQLISLLTYAMQILMSLLALSMFFVMVTISRASARRISEVLMEEGDMKNRENPVTQVKDGSVRFRDLYFGYRGEAGKQSLQGIDLEIGSGMTVGIIGGTGSGKSSLIQLIPRLYDVTRGSVEVGGVDVRDYDIESLRESVAVVLQKNVLFSGTIRDNLRWGKKDATEEEMVHAARLAQADSFIQSFPEGYDTWIEQGGSNVSGGQRQRLCIARALVKRPKILILDDSTSAVDTRTDAMLQKAFREEIPDTTKIIIAQRISSVQDADLIVVMDNGKISDCGTHSQLLESSSIYREVYQSQQKGGGENDAA